MKRIFLYVVLAMTLASCTSDPNENDLTGDSGVGNNDVAASSVLTYLPADQSRIKYAADETAYSFASLRSFTRAGEDYEYQYLPSPAIPSSAKEFGSGDMWEIGGSWVISESNNNTWFDVGWRNDRRPVEIYVAKSNITLCLNSYSNITTVGEENFYCTVYILAGVENVKISNNNLGSSWIIKNWGGLDLSAGLTMYNYSKIYNYGTEELKIGKFSTQDATDAYEFVSFGPVNFADGTIIKGGNYWFGSDVIFEDLNIQEHKKIDIRFKQCAKIGNIYFTECNAYCDFNVDYFLEMPTGFDSKKECKIKINLNNAVLVLGGESPVGRMTAGAEYGNVEVDNGRNVFVEDKYIYGYGTSAVFIQGSIYAYKDRVNNRVCDFIKTGNKQEDKLAVFGKRYKTVDGIEVTEEPVINVWIADHKFVDQGYDTPFADGGVLIKANDTEEFFIDYNHEEGNCRENFTNGPDLVISDGITPPKHKFSATGLDFLDVTNEDGTTDTYIYVCWHSNRAQDVDENETDHSHGTNVGDNGEEPSLANKDDWGGIIDIVRLSTYNPTDVNADGELYIESTIDQQDNEHKYNHVKFYDNKLYLATTSWLVGAALQIVPLDETHTHFDGNVRRVNLTGVSANCVEVVEDRDLVTISGRSLGGINWFPLNETASQEKKQINDNIKNYGGKYVCIDGQYIYALHNTEAATITQYDFSGNKVGELVTKEQLRPYDGKNALQVRDGKVYICCGRNGLQVYDWESKSWVGKTKLAANCVDIDEKGEYFYVATGGGLAKYKVGNVDENNYYVREKYVSYFGKGFIYPNGQTMGEGQKESSNFVKVHGDKIFVAYGMYGLRIYDANDLTSTLNDDHRTVND